MVYILPYNQQASQAGRMTICRLDCASLAARARGIRLRLLAFLYGVAVLIQKYYNLDNQIGQNPNHSQNVNISSKKLLPTSFFNVSCILCFKVGIQNEYSDISSNHKMNNQAQSVFRKFFKAIQLVLTHENQALFDYLTRFIYSIQLNNDFYILCQIHRKRCRVLKKNSNLSKDPTKKKHSRPKLSRSHVLAYGMGHTLNDLTATCWFNYLLYFLKKILFVDSATDAILIGQVVDGLATPLIGYLSDKFNTRIGQRKPWYIASIILLSISTVLLFSGYKSQSKQMQAFFYITVALVYCLGFAGLQISHMSLVPALTCSRKRRDQLNNLRNMFTFVSNFVVLGFGLLIFYFMSDKLLEYKTLANFATILGVAASIYFVFIINQPKLTKICKEKQIELKALLQKEKRNRSGPQKDEISSSNLTIQSDPAQKVDLPPQIQDSLVHWFKLPKFYLYGVCYVSARMYVNMFGTLIPFYINDVLQMVEDNDQKVSFNLALIPMLVYIGSLLTSCKLDNLYRQIGRKNSLLLGTLLCIVCCLSMTVIDQTNVEYFYCVAMLIGASQSLVLSTGVNLISDVVGAKAKSGAFVFDKIAVGIGIFLVGETEAYSRSSDLVTAQDRNFIKWTVILVPGIACVLSALILSTTSVNEYRSNEIESALSPIKSVLQKELVS